MTPGRTSDPWRCLFLVGLLCRASCQSVASTFENKTGQTEGKPRVFSPRMDYDEWTPLGRGDPLKNNPTYDYVPPVLDRVQYWLDSHTTEPSAKRDILVLGVTAKKTSPKLPEQMLKFVDGPKFTRSNQQGVSYRNEFTGSTGAEPPKIVRTSSFRNGPPIDYNAAPNRIRSVLSGYNPGSFYDGKTKPYTMMLPPPLSHKDKIPSFGDPTQRFNTQTEEGPVLQESRFHVPVPPPKKTHQQDGQQFSPSKSSVLVAPAALFPHSSKSKHEGPSSSTTTTADPSVSFEKSNLIYQSTQTLSGGWPAASTSAVPLSTATASFANRPTTRFIPDYSRDRYEFDHRVAAASSNHEVVVEQNANIIVEGESGENEEVVVGQKGSVRSSEAVAVAVSPPSTAAATTHALYSPSTSPLDQKKEYEGPGEEATTDRSSEKMHIVVANSAGGSSETETSEWKKGPVAVVMPTNYSEKRTTTMTNRSPGSTTVQDDSATTPATTTTTTTTTTPEPVTSAEDAYKSSIIGGGPIYSGMNHGSPNRMQQQHHHQHAIHSHAMTMGSFPPRHLGHPQTPLSSMMHPQAWPSHGTTHLHGGMRPNVGLRAPASISMFPPMTHMHAPPPPPPPPPPPAPHSGPSQVLQDFSAMLPPVSTLNDGSQSIGSIPPPMDRFSDRHRTRGPDADIRSTPIFGTPTPSPFLPTVASVGTTTTTDTVENSVFAVADAHARHPETDDPTPPRTTEEAKRPEENDESIRGVGGEGGNGSAPSAWPSTRVTTVPSLTTDPIFSHYKQPARPIRGPMYLIIQGHSKVKTYKPTVSKHGVPVERNEVTVESDGGGELRQQLSKFERFVQESTRKNGAGGGGSRGNAAAVEKKKAEEKARVEKLARARQNDLMSLVESGVGSFAASSAVTEAD